MEFVSDLAKANPLVILLIIGVIITLILLFITKGKWELRITRIKGDIEEKKQENSLMARALDISAQLTAIVEQDRGKLAEAIATQTASYDKISDALVSVKVGVDTLILGEDDAKRFREELRQTILRMSDIDETLKTVLQKIEEFNGVTIDDSPKLHN
jgi:hypothetical protein